MKIYHLEDEDEIKFIVKKVTDFSDSRKHKQVKKLRDTDWSHVQITSRAITFDGDTYNLTSHHSHELTIPKYYFGERYVDSLEEVDKNGEPDDDLEIDNEEENESEDDTKEW